MTAEEKKMFEKAEEIQEGKRLWLDGDCFYDSETGKVDLFCEGCNDEWGYFDKGVGAIWLPRQDQLQEMVETTETLPELIVQDKLAHFCMWVKYQCHIPLTSMEQLWLAFVMKEKYNKTWDGEEWLIQ